MSEEEDEKMARDHYEYEDTNPAYYRMKHANASPPSSSPAIPSNIRKGMMVSFVQHHWTAYLTRIDISGKELRTGVNLPTEKLHYALCVRTDTYNRWLDIIWRDGVFRLYARDYLEVKEAQEPP